MWYPYSLFPDSLTKAKCVQAFIDTFSLLNVGLALNKHLRMREKMRDHFVWDYQDV